MYLSCFMGRVLYSATIPVPQITHVACAGAEVALGQVQHSRVGGVKCDLPEVHPHLDKTHLMAAV